MESVIKANKIKIEKINENDYNRIFVMSDIHGQYDLFLKMLDRINLKREDLLVIIGDICDRGKKSYEIYMKCMKMIKLGYNLKFILGNHEDMLLEDLENELKIMSAYDQKISKDILDYYDRLWTNRDGEFTLPYDEHKNEKLMNDLLFRFMEMNGFGAF